MRTATRLALIVGVGVLWAGSAFAQTYDVTFQVDLNPYIESCQFDPETETVTTPGDMNGWDTSAFPLDDPDSDGVYTGTYELPAGAITYKHFTSGTLGWEDATDNRTYTVTTDPSQTISVVTFADGEPVDLCGGTAQEDYELIFTVDMNVAIQRGAFDEDSDEVAVAGAFNGWDTGDPDAVLTESSTQDNVYTGIIEADSLETPSTQPYKFIIRHEDATIGWESGSDRTFEITGSETDADADGLDEVFVPSRFFDDVTFDDVLTGPATVTFEVDGRPAYYVLADSSAIPGNEPQTSVDGIWINGPAMWESDEAGGPGDGIQDWLGWTGELTAFPDLGDADADGDSIFTITLHYSEGALRTLVGKLGVNGRDNEANFGNDHYYEITEGTQTIEKVFGAMRQSNGLYNDDNGPNGAPTYDPYILIDDTANPPTVEVVRSGGEADGTSTATEPGAELPDGITLGQSFPNPVRGEARIAFSLEQGQDVALRVYDLTGRLVATLAEGFRPAGDHAVDFDARGLASGAYLYRLEADGRVVSRMMTLLK